MMATENKFSDRLISTEGRLRERAEVIRGERTKDGGRLVAQVEYGGCVANIYEDPDNRRVPGHDPYSISFVRQFREDDTVMQSTRFAAVDLQSVSKLAKLAEEKLQDIKLGRRR